MNRKSIVIFLCLALLVTMIPFTSLAGETQERNYFKNIDHTYDNALLEVMTKGEVKDTTDIFGNAIKATDITDDKYGLTKSTYNDKTYYVRYVNPEIFGIDHIAVVYNYSTGAVKDYHITWTDEVLKYREDMAKRIPEVMNEVYARIPKGATTFEKVHIVHDYLISCTAYNQTNLVGDIFDTADNDITGPFLKHRGMCLSYSLAYKYILDELGITCGVATSVGANHAWNIVKIDGQWYHVDLTGDDKGYDILGRCEHKYLCLSTESLLKLDSSRSDFIVYLNDYTQSFNDNTCATSKKYESGQLWNETYSPCIYYGNSIFTVGEDNNIYKDGKKFASIPTLESVWRPNGIEGWNYTNLVPRFAVLAYGGGNTCYINSTRHIFEVNLDTGAMKSIYETTADSQHAIYGIAIVEDELMCAIEKIAGDGEETWTKVKDVTIPKTEKPGKVYSDTKEINLTTGESKTITFDNVNIKSTVDTSMTDAKVATVTARDEYTPASESTSYTTSQVTSFKTGTYVIGYGEVYLVNSGGTLTTTKDISKASKWNLSGSTSTCYLENNGYYIGHSTSAISLSKTKSSWKFSSGKFYFTKSSGLFRTTTYNLVYSSGFKVSTSTTNSKVLYKLSEVKKTAAEEKYTTVSVKAVAAGSATFEIGDVLYKINVTKAPATVSIKVNILDDEGMTIKTSYSISGLEGSSYEVKAEAISGYITPTNVTGTFAEGENEDINLVYVLNTNKSALQSAINGKVAKGNYTDDSYSSYESSISKGQAILSKARATQSEVDNALKAINDAKAALAVKVTGFALDSDGINSGNSYIIVDNGYALSGVSALKVTISGSNVNDPKSDNAVWKITKTSSGYTIYNTASKKYLSYKASGLGSKRTCTLTLSSTKTNWKVSQSGSEIQLYVSSTYKFYLNCADGKFQMSRTAGGVKIYTVK